MALNSTPRRRFGVALGVVLTGVAAGLIGFAGSASAHTPEAKASCEGETTTLSVNFQKYATSKKKENHIKILDGDKVLVDEGFQDKFVRDFETSGAVDHTFVIAVKAFDDSKYNYDKTLTVKACVTTPPSSETTTTTTEVPPSSTTTTTTTETTETTTTTSEEEVPPSSTPAPTTTTSPEVKEEALAETGASIGLPLGIAGVLLVGGAVLLFVVRRRSKA